MPGEKKSVTPAEGLVLNVTNAVLIPGKKSKGGGEGASSVPYIVHARTTDGNGVPIDFPICILREKLTENATLGSTFPSDAPLEFEVHRGESSSSSISSAVHLSGYLQMDPTFDESDEDDDGAYMPGEFDYDEDQAEDEDESDVQADSQPDESEGEEFDSEDDNEDVTQIKKDGKRLPRLPPAGNVPEVDEDSEESDDEYINVSEEVEGYEIKPSKDASNKVTELVDSEADESNMSEDDEEEVLSSKKPQQRHSKREEEKGGGSSIAGHKEMSAGAKRKLSNLASAVANANPEVKKHQTPKKQQQQQQKQQMPTSKGIVATPQTTGSGKKRNRHRGKKNKSK